MLKVLLICEISSTFAASFKRRTRAGGRKAYGRVDSNLPYSKKIRLKGCVCVKFSVKVAKNTTLERKNTQILLKVLCIWGKSTTFAAELKFSSIWHVRKQWRQ